VSARNDGGKPPKKNEPVPPEKVEEPGKAAGPFDVRTVKSLVALMAQHDLSEIDLRDGTQRLRLRRGAYQPVAPTSPAAPPPALPVASPAAPARAESTASPSPARQLVEIKSPTPGTFYSAPKPGEPPFVKVGARIAPETVVCLIEAMKLYNEVQAECAGVIVEALVENQQPVEYGQVLFKVDPAG
jgi:acetyl-CoA carboxylase biotin carboxyl carrier protein